MKVKSKVDLTIKDKKIVTLRSQNKNISLKERFNNYNGGNLACDFSWDKAKGKELEV